MNHSKAFLAEAFFVNTRDGRKLIARFSVPFRVSCKRLINSLSEDMPQYYYAEAESVHIRQEDVTIICIVTLQSDPSF